MSGPTHNVTWRVEGVARGTLYLAVGRNAGVHEFELKLGLDGTPEETVARYVDTLLPPRLRRSPPINQLRSDA